MRVVLINVFLLIVLVSCEEAFVLDIEQTPEKIVIEGLITDRPEYQSIKVTRSAGFYETGKTPRVTDAVVHITDDLGVDFAFVHNPREHADSMGIYIPLFPFAGEIGRTYYMTVIVDDQTYEASDILTSGIPIDSLAFEENTDEAEDPEIDGRFYEVLLFATEPQDEENYYLFKFYRNDSLRFANDTDIYFSDDELLAENIDGIPAPIYYSMGDTAVVEAFSITRPAYVYYSDLATLINGDAGGMFGPVPSSPRSNISNGALGLFQVSAVVAKGIKLE
jgi:hypothetical protein